mmetsp:Transcript_102251/g.266894  ORF Transcript_102251/g.266894 Transcript_102251/m.266894 type:complete len:243 (-) Transcript_102251:23-751(-)
MSSSTSRMFPPCALYASAAGAPSSCPSAWSSALPWASAISLLRSPTGSAAASTTAPRERSSDATLPLSTFCCTKADLPNLRCNMLLARFSVSMTSTNSFSAVTNSELSLARMVLAALSSASASEMSAARASILVVSDTRSAFAFSMVAVKSSISPSAVWISKPRSLVPNLQLSICSSYAFVSPSASFESFPWRPVSMSITFPIGVTPLRTLAAPAHGNTASSRRRARGQSCIGLRRDAGGLQ